MDNICNICGGSYVYKNGKWICSCCDNIKNEKITNEEVILLTNASAKLRMAAFDDAEELYRDFVKKYPKNPEGYWGLLLSKYGIKYEEDYDGKKVPTIYATSIESVLEDKNYQLAVEYADKDQKRYYKQQAQQFENIRQEWIEKASKEPPVDVFICFKDSDEEHNITRTDDSYEAQNLYTYLISKGYSVFFSRESLRDKVAEKYEPYIFNALNTAKVMVVYSSSREYMESTWVKNEWTRFLKKIKNGEKQKNSLVVSFEKMTASDLPKAFASCQCMDASKKTFYEDLDNHIRKVINESSVPTTKIDRVELGSAKKQKTAAKAIENLKTRDLSKYKVQQLTADEKTELKTAKICLSKELFDDALQSANRLLEINPNNGQALYIKLCAEENISSEEDLVAKAGTIKKINRFETIIENSSKEDSINLLNMLVSGCSLLIKKNNIEKALEYYNLISQYDFDYKNIVEDFKNKAYRLVDSKNYNLVERIVSSLLKTITDTNEYLDVLKNLIIGFRKSGERELTLNYCKKYIEVFDCDYEILWIKLCAEIGCLDDSVLHNYIANLKDFDSFKTILEYSPTEEKRNLYITTTLNAVVKKIQSKEIENIELLAKVFDEVIKYTNKKNKEKTLQIVLKMASACQLNYKFDLSEKYFAIALSENKSCHEAYWGLLQSKLKARNNNELIEQPTIISTMPDFHSAIAAAGDDERISEKYIDIKAKQLKYIEHKAEVDKAKKKKKRKIKIISIIVAIALAIGAALGGYGVYYSSENKLLYTLSEDGKGYIVSAGKFYDENVITIPETYNGKEVIGIAENAFKNKNLTSLNIPSTVQEIDDNAFYGCDNLANIKFDGTLYQGIYSSDLTTIGNYAFYGCSELKTVQLPESVESVGKYAFANCNKLNSINLTSNISELPEGLFENSFSYTISSISIPENIDYIGKNVFNNCTKLSKIFIDEREEIPHNWDNNWCGNNTNNYEIIWTLKVDLNYNGGTSTSNKTSISVVLGENFECPVPTKLGYIFEGWGYTKNEQFTLLTDEEGLSRNAWNIEEDITLTAKWTARDYEITYHLNGGENHTQNPSSFTIETDTFELFNPTRSYYEFEGWYTNELLTNPITSITKGTTGHIDVYAKWTPIEYDITYVMNGGTNNNLNPNTYNVETYFDFENPFKKGFEFKGWFTDSEFNNEISRLNRQYLGDIALYAKWEIITYPINYELNGGTNNVGNKSNYTVETDTFSLLNPTREHYTFGGWFNDNSYTSELNSIEKGTIGQKTLYAKWTPIEYNITYILNGGTNNNQNPNTYNVEDEIIFAEPTRNGYSFKGWFTDSEFNNEITNINREFLDEITLYAEWEIITYPINYELNGGTNNPENKSNYTIETDTFELKNPTREHYSFNGWYDFVFDTRVTEVTKGTFGEKTFCARWTPIEYDINYVLNGGTNNAQNPTTYNVEDSFVFKTPTKTAYTFMGWFSNEELTQEFSSLNSQYYGEITLYAKWTPTTYNIGYAMNGGTNNPLNPTSYNVESEDIILQNPTKSGYDFRCWYLNGVIVDRITTGTYGNLVLTPVFDAIFEVSSGTINGLTEYGKNTYNEIVIPEEIHGNTITKISSAAFKDDTSLTKVEIPATVTSIGNGAFSGCSSLTDIVIPFVGGNSTSSNSTSAVFGYIFGTQSYEGSTKTTQQYRSQGSYSTYTETFYIPTSLKNVKVLNGDLKYGAFHNCVDLENIEIMNATLIDSYGVNTCTSLKTITLPKSLTSVTAYAFQYSDSLEKVYYKGEINDWAVISFGNNTSNPMYYAQQFYLESDKINEVTKLNLTAENIGYAAFYGFNNVDEIIINESVKTIGNNAFFGCSKVTTIDVPTTVTKIGSSAFGNWYSLESIKLPFVGTDRTSNESTASVFGYVFGGSGEQMTSVTQNYSPYSTHTYMLPTALKTVEIYDGNLKYAGFSGCTTLETIVISSQTTTLTRSLFSGCTNLKNLTLPKSIKTTDTNVFNNNNALDNVYYNGTLEDWNKITFTAGSSNPMGYADHFFIKNGEDWEEVTELDLTDLETIGDYAFYGFNNITTINLSTNLQTIGTYSFAYCSNVNEIVVPDSVTGIGYNAFGACTSLATITLPFVGASTTATGSSNILGFLFDINTEGTTATHQQYSSSSSDTKFIPTTLKTVNISGGKIGYGTFYNCETIETISLSDSITNLGIYSFYGCTKLKNINIPGVVTIQDKAFYQCTTLESITLPKSIKTIKDGAFVTNSSLFTNVYFKGTINEWANIAFASSTANPLYSAEHLYIEESEGVWKEINSLDLTGLETISEYSFYGFEGLSELVIGNTLKIIPTSAFYSCINLIKLDLTGVEQINNSAFYDCDSLSYLIIPDSVKTIDKKAFGYSANLKYVYISDSVTTIKTGSDDDYSPFVGCSNVAFYCEGSKAQSGWESYWNISRTPNYEIEIEEFMFIADFKAENYTLIDGVYYYISSDKTIVYALGVDDKTMTDITLYSKTTRIGFKAFSGCTKLKNITLRSTIKRISDKAFESCSTLTNVYYDGTIEDWCNVTIGNISAETSFFTTPMYYADHFFIKNGEDWEEVTELVIPDSITEIGLLQFYGFEYLTSVIIPSSVTRINNCAFYNCLRVTNLTIGENVTYIGNRAFYDCDKLTSIYIPKSVVDISASANNYSPFFGCSSSLKIYCGVNSKLDGWGKYWNCYYATSNSNNSYLTAYYDYEYEEYLFAIATDKSSFTLIDNVYYYINEDESKVYALGVSDKTASEIVLDERTTRISPIAFKNCTALTSIVIPENVEYIALDAFTGSTNLTTVYVDSTDIYNSLESKYSCGSVFENSSIIYVLQQIVNTETSNEYLNNADVFNKVEEGEYFKYSRI
ncbi:MAG: leucine-rich repeat protein [Clostridia bacterium]|nr:leucine-rich repeat protein [Clostridia bacterium]